MRGWLPWQLAVTSDLSSGQLIQVPTPGLDLRRTLRAIWDGTSSPPAGAARDLIIHILSPRRREPASPPSARDNRSSQIPT